MTLASLCIARHDSAQFSPSRAWKCVTADLIMTAAPPKSSRLPSAQRPATQPEAEAIVITNESEQECLYAAL